MTDLRGWREPPFCVCTTLLISSHSYLFSKAGKNLSNKMFMKNVSRNAIYQRTSLKSFSFLRDFGNVLGTKVMRQLFF